MKRAQASSPQAEGPGGGVLAKRSRVDAVQENAVAIYDEERDLVAVDDAEARTSGLFAPTMQLSGHGAAIYTMKFDPTGKHLASGSFDRRILLWDVYDEHCTNYMMVEGHKNAVLELHWTADGSELVTCSADKMVALWDAETGKRLRKLQGHGDVVNSVCPVRRGPLMLASGGDDRCCKLWDARSRTCLGTLRTEFPVTAVCFNDNAEQVIFGGIDNKVRVWDVRKRADGGVIAGSEEGVVLTLSGHADTITSLALSPDGAHVLSNGMDNALRCWDIRPFAEGDRCVRTFVGANHNHEKILLRCNWSADGARVGVGGADRNVYVWDFESGAMQYQLPGHKGSVNEVCFHPKEPIIGSCSSDKSIFLGELAPTLAALPAGVSET